MTSPDRRPASGTRRPVRILHLGLGNFFRAHQAWYTAHADDAAAWGIAAFTGRTWGDAAARLAANEGVYTLVARAADGDEEERIESVVDVRSSESADDWRRVWSLPDLSIVTMTITEAGYRARGQGSAASKLVEGLALRRDAGLGPVTLVPCDNLPGNGQVLRAAVSEVAQEVDPDLARWIDDRCGFVTTMVDRITPRPDDPLCVVTEPYSEWVLSGQFVAGRPAWESAGARFVDDLEPWEQRKLWLLNGSHSLMAYAASIRGHASVAEAIADPVVHGWVEQWWDDAARHLTLPPDEIASYRKALLSRYENPRIRHQLAQIAADGSQKLPVRIVPVVRAELARGRLAPGATRALAAWVMHLRGVGAAVADVGAADLAAAVAGADLPDAVQRVLAFLGVDDAAVRDAVLEQARQDFDRP